MPMIPEVDDGLPATTITLFELADESSQANIVTFVLFARTCILLAANTATAATRNLQSKVKVNFQ